MGNVYNGPGKPASPDSLVNGRLRAEFRDEDDPHELVQRDTGAILATWSAL